MAGNAVVVHDVDKLEVFGGVLQGKRDELESLYVSLSAETSQQEPNWQDPTSNLYLSSPPPRASV